MAEVGRSDALYAELEAKYSSGGVSRRDVTVVRAAGAHLYDEDGKSYIDFSSAHGWANVGHCHPLVTQAIREQSETLVALTESAYNDQRSLWFRDLTRILGREIGPSDRGLLSRVFPCSSGTEAVEAALKMARLFTGRSEILAFRRGFHGRTMGSLSATAKVSFKKPFEPLVPDFTHIAFNDVAALDAAVTEKTAGVILEVIQGEGGVHEAQGAFLDAVRKCCTERGALLLVDEVQTGLGRTGSWFACQHDGPVPDILILGKSLGGGIPMGATVWREALGAIPAGSHGSTFGGGPLPCAAGRATLEVIDRERLPERAATLGELVQDQLRSSRARAIREVRGLGLMIGIELRSKVGPVLRQLMERGVWALPAGANVLRLLPPLVISDEALAEGMSIVVETLRA